MGVSAVFYMQIPGLLMDTEASHTPTHRKQSPFSCSFLCFQYYGYQRCNFILFLSCKIHCYLCPPPLRPPAHTHTHISAYAPGRCKIIWCVPSLKHSSLKVGEGNRERKKKETEKNRECVTGQRAVCNAHTHNICVFQGIPIRWQWLMLL